MLSSASATCFIAKGELSKVKALDVRYNEMRERMVRIAREKVRSVARTAFAPMFKHDARVQPVSLTASMVLPLDPFKIRNSLYITVPVFSFGELASQNLCPSATSARTSASIHQHCDA